MHTHTHEHMLLYVINDMKRQKHFYHHLSAEPTQSVVLESGIFVPGIITLNPIKTCITNHGKKSNPKYVQVV